MGVRFDVELGRTGYQLNRPTAGAPCGGTDVDNIARGYQRRIEISGEIGSTFSRIVADLLDVHRKAKGLKPHAEDGGGVQGPQDHCPDGSAGRQTAQIGLK